MPQTESPKNNDNRYIAYWLLGVCALIFCMVVLGGVTRLTRSGLSMVDWQPIMGVIPPLNQQEWQSTFEKYQQYPEYRHVNKDMSLDEFKSIFYFEYTHRLLGRLIGLAFLLPFLYFLLRGKIRRSLIPQLVTMFLLGGLQGLLGWYMVKSGLIHEPRVSQYRLTAHLGAAMLIFGYMLWTALSLLHPEPVNRQTPGIGKLHRFSLAITALIIVMILSGGFVAGTRAGYILNTFPLMYGQFIPPGMYTMQPFYLNWFENLISVQFNHRMIAYLLLLTIPTFWFVARRYSLANRSRRIINLLGLMLIVQVTLGITTLIYIVPVALGAAHQGGALVLLTLALMVNHELRS